MSQDQFARMIRMPGKSKEPLSDGATKSAMTRCVTGKRETAHVRKKKRKNKISQSGSPGNTQKNTRHQETIRKKNKIKCTRELDDTPRVLPTHAVNFNLTSENDELPCKKIGQYAGAPRARQP